MTKYVLEPEVAGQLGSNCVLNTSVHPPLVSILHYEFDGWLGDDLLESFPCFIVSEKLKFELEKSILSGFTISTVEITKSEIFQELQPKVILPEFFWLKISDNPSSDFSINLNNELVVTEKAFDFLSNFNLDNCDITKN